MLRRSALTFAERALVSSSRTRMASAAQKRGMGACFIFSVAESERASLSLYSSSSSSRGEGKIDRSVFSLFLLRAFTIKTRAGALSTDPISFSLLSLFQIRMNAQLVVKEA